MGFSTPERSRAISSARTQLERGFRYEQAGTLARALEAYRAALAASSTIAERAESHLRIARVHRSMAAWEQSLDEARAALQLADEISDDDLAAEAMNIEIGALQIQGFLDAADELAQRAITRARSPRVRGITLQNLGRSAAERADFATSERYFTESIAAFREAKYEIGLVIALANAAKVALDRGDATRSIEMGDEAIVIARRLNALDLLLAMVQNQAAAFVAIGNLESAEDLLTEALGHFTSARNLVRQAECLEIMGQLSERRPDPETALRCYTRARDLALAAGDHLLLTRLTKRLEGSSAP